MAFLNMYDFRKESCYLEMAEAAAEELLKHAVSQKRNAVGRASATGHYLAALLMGVPELCILWPVLPDIQGKADIGMRLFRHFCMKGLYIVRRKAVGGI